jgi:hypothetical protein
MADLVYELMSQLVKNTNININLSPNTKPSEQDSLPSEASSSEASSSEASSSKGCSIPPATEQKPNGFMRADLVQLISELESVATTLKRINKSVVGHEDTELFFMLQNFDKILHLIKQIINAV